MNTPWIITLVGLSGVVGVLSLAFTKYNLNDSHDLSKFLGGLGFSVAILVYGLFQLRN